MDKRQAELKKEMVLNAISLGMCPDDAYRLAECTFDERELLEKDTHFKELVDYEVLKLERDLLESYREAIDIAVEKGNTKPIQWLLERINNRYNLGSKETNNSSEPNRTVVYLPDNGRN